jgi:hypothetical protein
MTLNDHERSYPVTGLVTGKLAAISGRRGIGATDRRPLRRRAPGRYLADCWERLTVGAAPSRSRTPMNPTARASGWCRSHGASDYASLDVSAMMREHIEKWSTHA